jgi:hypothetical protein
VFNFISRKGEFEGVDKGLVKHKLLCLSFYMNLFNRKHPLEQQIVFLAEREQFMDFLDWIAAGREACIGQLQRAPEGRLREISGKIQVYDEILSLCGYQQLLIKRAARMAQGLPS